MILGIVVTRPGLAEAEAQEAALRAAGASEVKTIAPMTNEDWYYRVREAVSELASPAQKILVQAPHYLGPDGLAIARALVDLSEDAELAFIDEEGINTTQATLSRDLFELHATKVRGDDGKPAYVLRDTSVNEVFNGPENGGINRLTKWCQDLLVVATYNGNFVILRTPAGAAQLMASSLDNSLLPEMMGCVAGDDTVLIMCTDPDSARRLTSKLLALADDTVTNIE